MIRSLLISWSIIWLCAWSSAPARAQSTPPTWKWANGQRMDPNGGPSSTATDNQGNVYVSGYHLDSLRLGPRTLLKRTGGYLAKYNSTGTLLWAQELFGMGGGRIILDGAGGIFLGGSLTANTDFPQVGGLSIAVSKLSTCGYLAKFDAQGQPEWLRSLGASLTGVCYFSDFGLDASGNFYLTGAVVGTVPFGPFTLSTGSTASSFPLDAFLMKLSPQGVPQWVRQGGRTKSNMGQFFGLTVSAGGDLYLTGAVPADTEPFDGQPLPAAGGYADVLLMKYNAQGTPQWLRRYPAGAEHDLGIPHSAVLDGLGRLAVPLEYKGRLNLGSQTLDSGGAVRNGALAAFDTATGNLVWVTTLQSPGYSFGNAVAVDAANNYYFLGDFSYTTTIGGQTLTYANGQAGIIACLSSQGTVRWLKQTDTVLPYLVSVGSSGHLSVAGSYSEAPTLDGITLPKYSYTLSQSRGLFVGQFGALALAARAGSGALPLALYPNPAHASVTLPALPARSQLRILDALGRTVRQPALAPTLALDGLAPGIYHVQASTPDGQQWHGQLLVE